MKTLKEALFSRRNLNSNPFGLTKDDLKGEIFNFPMGVVVRMLEEQELQGNEPDVTVFQNEICSGVKLYGFDWDKTEAGWEFWAEVIDSKNFKPFFKNYPDYEMYNIS